MIYKKGKGLPIGNMSSQVIAILYLNELDHFIKEKLKIKYYERYMDDGIILHEDREYLEYCLKEITKILDKYKLKLNNKTKIIDSRQGFEFLGFRYYIKNNRLIMKVKNQTKKKFKRKMSNLYKLIELNRIKEKKLLQIKASYLGCLSYGNCNNLINKNIKSSHINDIQVRIDNNKIVYK